MSFTSTVKNEISKIEFDGIENISELSAIIRNAGTISENIVITTENASVARRVFNLVKETFNVIPKITVRRGFNFNKNYIYILELNKKVSKIIERLNLENTIPDDYIYNEDALAIAYLRGLFLVSGSINDPKKSRYHLEFFVDDEKYAKFIVDLLNKFDFNSKYIKRENKYMIYIKEAERISNFLIMMKAVNSLFYYEDIRIYRDHKNMTNRLNNCEQANIDKQVETATKQINDINKIMEIGGLELLSAKTKEVAEYRLKYPDVSLLELSEIISIETGKSITKSGVYHRMKKISDLASKIK